MSIQDIKYIDESKKWYEYLEEEDLPERDIHATLIYNLRDVLGVLYRAEGWYLSTNLLILSNQCPPTSPDIALYKGIVLSWEEREPLTSWRVDPPERPAPSVVFEIASESTWPNDVELDKKPLWYKQMGVKEYFVYDPNTPQFWGETAPRLRGWRYDPTTTSLIGQELVPNEQGWLYSLELDSWLKPNRAFLLLLDQKGQQRLTSQEAEQEAERKRIQAEQAQIQAERAQKQAERVQKQAERKRIQAERKRIQAEQAQIQAEQAQIQAEQAQIQAEQAQIQAEQAQIQAEQEAQQSRQLLEEMRTKLKAKGLDPDNL